MNDAADAFEAVTQEASKALFNRRYRLAVLAHVAGSHEPELYVREVARALRIADNQVSPDFRALCTVGALERTSDGQRHDWHRKVTDHPVWAFADEALRVLAEHHQPHRVASVLTSYRSVVLGLGRDRLQDG